MQRIIIDIIDGFDNKPGRSAWIRGVYCLAADMFSSYIERKGLNIWDSAARIGKITERDLLDGAKNWKQQSRDGNYLVYNQDICRLLCNEWDQRRTCDGKLPPNDYEDWSDFQARALEQAARVVMAAVNR